MSDTFDSLGFKPEYRCTINPEFPGTGSWDSPTFEFPQIKTPNEPFRSPWGAPLVIRVEPGEGTGWIGFFRSGGIGGLTGAFGCPNPGHICVSAKGDGYLVNVEKPIDYAALALTPVLKIRRVPDAELVLLTSFISMLALDQQGPLWITDRLCLDDLEVIAASSSAIVCSGSWLGEPQRFTVDPESGTVISGPVFVRDFPQFMARGERWRRERD